MGRWTQYDEDEYRLPEGMRRVGYDSDTQRYFFRDSSGKLYHGAEGAEFGNLTPVDDEDAGGMFQEGNDEEGGADATPGPTRPDGYQPLDVAPGVAHPASNTSAYRTLFPFFLIIAVVLLLVWRLITPSAPPPSLCPAKSAPYWVKGGDTCWDVAKTYGCSVEVIKELNPQLDCDNLKRGDKMCLPLPENL